MSAPQSATQKPAWAAPFDAMAARYDETFTWSKIGQGQRAAVWRELAKTFRPGDSTLEIGCGTGVDACFLAERNIRVLASDPSSQMIDVTRRRIQQRGLQNLVRPLVLGAEEIGLLQPDELFDGALSNFGALNCVEDLTPVARGLARLLKPGAMAVLCWMGPRCAWETIWYLAQGNRDKAFRRFQAKGTSAKLCDGAFVQVHYPSVQFLEQAFAPDFKLISVQGIGVAVPPSYLEPWAQRHPSLLNVFERVDLWLAGCPGFRSLGDHVLVRLQREPTRRGWIAQ